MAPGGTREIPSGLGDIAPDGMQLDRFNPIFPSVTVDTIGSTPFQTNDFFKVKYLSGSASDIYLSTLLVDLSPVNAFVDSSNAPPGLAGSPLGFSNLNGISRGDITATGFNDGSQLMQLEFSANSFLPGESFNFGVDIDLFSNIDGFGATPSELNGAVVNFSFSNGYGLASALDEFIAPSIFDPLANIDVISLAYIDIEPITTQQIPAPGALLLGGVGMGVVGWLRRRRTL